MRRIGRWIGGHPLISTFLAIVLVIAAFAGGGSGAGAGDGPSTGTTSAADHSPTSTATATAATTASPPGDVTPSSTPSPGATTPSPTSPGAGAQTPAEATGRLATQVLETLAVKGRAPRTGYARTEKFGTAWDDGSGRSCDTRQRILARDLVDVVYRGGSCTVASGVLHDPYTGRTIDFVRGQKTSTAVQIDHVVALSDAWQKGAQQWDQATRVAFANDPGNLLAVDGPTNEKKGDGDAATWLPPDKSYRCAYVARQIGVKARYGVWVTKAEKEAMARVLATCPKQVVLVNAAR